MDFDIPADIAAYLGVLDDFIEREIRPLEHEADNIRFFDHRREHARTDWDNDGQPRPEWEELLAEMKRRADKAGHLRFALPKELGGKDGSNLAMARLEPSLPPSSLGKAKRRWPALSARRFISAKSSSHSGRGWPSLSQSVRACSRRWSKKRILSASCSSGRISRSMKSSSTPR